MIYGIGHDVLEIERVAAILQRPHGERFMARVLTAAEWDIARRRAARQVEFVSGRFAAKEAITKAFGCGIGKMIGFDDIEILPDQLGKPNVVLSDAAWQRLGLQAGQHSYRVHLSISHQPHMAAAFAVVERLDRNGNDLP
ncbi:holo-ACP synthase [Paenibacillus campi]|uniref:holo-ACP synthase n=1 Tax=Paenibacillus campi TaxID=3106031 RepID=UPI002AFFCACA|nr:holo-ACP synthase [Paenibacillus sp. SGZ-1014]